MGERQVVDIPLVGGFQEKTDEPYLDPTAQITALNTIWIKRNSIEKRPGWLGLSNSVRVNSALSAIPTTLGNAAGLFPHPTATYAVTDGTSVYASADPGALTWLDMIPPCVGTRRSIASSTNGVANPETAEANGIRVVVWEDAVVGPNSASGPTTGNLLYYALMKTSSAEVFEFGIIDQSNAGYQPRLTVNGTVVTCWWQAGPTASGTTNRRIYAATLDLGALPSSPGWRSLGVLVNNSSPGQGWDVAAMSTTLNAMTGANTTTAVIVYTAVGSSNVVTVQPLSLSGTLWSTGTSFSVSGEGTQNTFVAMGIRYQQLTSSTAILYIAYAYPPTSSPSLVRLTSYNVTIPGLVFTQNFSPTTIKSSTSGTPFYGIAGIGIETYNNGGNCVVVVGSDQSTLDGGVFWTTATSAGSILATNSVYNLQLLSRPFAVKSTDLTYGVRIFAVVGDVTTQVSHFLAEFDIYVNATVIDSPRPVCTIAPRLNFTAGGQLLRSLNSISSATYQGNTIAGVYSVAGTFSETSNNPANFSALSIAFDFGHPARFQSAVLGNLIYTSGGMPSPWDGVNMVESASLYSVSTDTFHSNASGGALTNNTVYSYVFVPEWRDDKGNVHQGHPSPIITIPTSGNTGSASASVSGNVKTLALTQKGIEYREAAFGQASLYLVPYRSAVIAGSMSQTLFRLVGDDPGSAYLSNPINPSISFSDTLSDATLAGHPLLYTTGGLVSNDTPSSFAGICSHNGRVYGIGDDLHTIWISGPQTDGVPCTFSDAMQTSVSFLGDLTAIWSMDDKLFVASQTGIAYMTGSGPNGQGVQSDLSQPTAIPSDVGVRNAQAWCVTPIGTVFQHAFGLGLLDRSLSVHSEFGDPVTDILKNSTVTGILLHPTRPEILVLVTQSGGVGSILSYNYRFSAWSDWIITDQAVTSLELPPAAGLVAGGRLFAADGAGGLVAQEGAGLYFDAVGGSNIWITMLVQTGWLKPGGLQGWGKLLEVQLLFTTLDQAGLSVSFGYDYNDSSFSTAQTFTAAQIGGFPDSGGTISRVRVRPFQARCESVRIQLEDLQSGGPMSGQGFRWHGVSALVEPHQGLQRLPGSQGA